MEWFLHTILELQCITHGYGPRTLQHASLLGVFMSCFVNELQPFTYNKNGILFLKHRGGKARTLPEVLPQFIIIQHLAPGLFIAMRFDDCL